MEMEKVEICDTDWGQKLGIFHFHSWSEWTEVCAGIRDTDFQDKAIYLGSTCRFSQQVFNTGLDKALSNLVWRHGWPCFEQGFGVETSWGPCQPEWSHERQPAGETESVCGQAQGRRQFSEGMSQKSSKSSSHSLKTQVLGEILLRFTEGWWWKRIKKPQIFPRFVSHLWSPWKLPFFGRYLVYRGKERVCSVYLVHISSWINSYEVSQRAWKGPVMPYRCNYMPFGILQS